MMQVSHDGTGDDYKGDIILYVNDGDDAAGSLTEVLRIDSAKLATFAGAITVTGVITNSEIPVFTKGVVANDTYLQGRNSADDGNVDMIKIGRNEADDTDVVQLPDKVRTASDIAPTEDTQIANKKYVDDEVSSALPDDDAFGSWASKLDNTVYQAASDGFVTAWVNTGSGSVEGYTDSSNPPTTLRVKDTTGQTNRPASIMFPVRKGHFWKTVGANGGLWWLPVGG